MYKVTKQDLQLPSSAQGNLRYLINLDQLSPRGPRAATKATKNSHGTSTSKGQRDKAWSYLGSGEGKGQVSLPTFHQ